MALWPTAATMPVKIACNYFKPRIPNPKTFDCSSPFKPTPSCESSFRSHCIKSQINNEPGRENCEKGFSVLSPDIPWEKGSTWSTMALYMFNLHIPLGIGGLSIVAYALQQPSLDPQTEALSLLVIEILELLGALVLLSCNAKPEYKVTSLFKTCNLAKERNWLLASALGFGLLIFLVFLTSVVADEFVGPKAVNNPVMKEILLRSDISRAACVLIYCLIAPLLEEVIYRGFLLTSLASMMNWQQAVFFSSAAFSAAHFSGENFVQLFIIGSVLGCCYCWTGNLSSSLMVHSLYNVMTLIITYLS